MEKRLSQLLNAAVGPTPWYWRTFPALDADGVTFTWRSIENDHVVVLERPGFAAPVLALGFYARPLVANPGYILVWCPGRDSLEISIFELAGLEPLSDTEWPSEEPRGAERRIVSRTPPVSEITIREGLSVGVHRHHAYRSGFAETVEEVLLLGAGPIGSRAEASIYVWRPGRGEVEVFPQDWFTDEFDLGYEWIARVVRDPRSGRFVGDGIRVPDFMLGEDGRTLVE